jgi:hypothetical protein
MLQMLTAALVLALREGIVVVRLSGLVVALHHPVLAKVGKLLGVEKVCLGPASTNDPGASSASLDCIKVTRLACLRDPYVAPARPILFSGETRISHNFPLRHSVIKRCWPRSILSQRDSPPVAKSRRRVGLRTLYGSGPGVVL